MNGDSLINRRKRGKELLKSVSAMLTGRTAGQTGISEDVGDLGGAVKQLNAEAGRISKTDPGLADQLRRMALRAANIRKRR